MIVHDIMVLYKTPVKKHCYGTQVMPSNDLTIKNGDFEIAIHVCF